MSIYVVNICNIVDKLSGCVMVQDILKKLFIKNEYKLIFVICKFVVIG